LQVAKINRIMTDTTHRDALLAKIKSHDARVAVIGLGYVGLPLAVGFARVGFDVAGIEISEDKVGSINRGDNYIQDVDSDELKELVVAGKLRATNDFSVLKDTDCIVICVPTPLNKTSDPDISAIVSARDRIRENLHAPQLIILESTSYPGTVDELIKPYLAEAGLAVGQDYFLAFSPERVDPNNPVYKVENTPKVIGGVTPDCTEVAATFYGQLVKEVVSVSSPAAAEMTKLLENTFRLINIGLANEVAIICRLLGLDVWEVINAAATKPFGFMPFYPGPGLGGHCIPIDPSYLSWKLRAMKYRTRFIELANEINTAMPEYVVKQAVLALNDEGKAVKGAKTLLLGVAYKRDIDDIRESPAHDVLKLMEGYGAQVTYHDPHVPEWRDSDFQMKSVELTPVTLKAQDIVLIITDHSAVDYQLVSQHARLVFDTRNAMKNVKNPAAKIVKL